MNRDEEVIVCLIVSCDDCPEVFEFVNVPFDKVPVFVKLRTELRRIGRPTTSTSTSIFVVSPPRERPIV
ncbi:MAG: hypothetical protein ACU0C9_13015 [Paracoccaceae bacterium]